MVAQDRGLIQLTEMAMARHLAYIRGHTLTLTAAKPHHVSLATRFHCPILHLACTEVPFWPDTDGAVCWETRTHGS
jgi:hypothetical protein